MNKDIFYASEQIEQVYRRGKDPQNASPVEYALVSMVAEFFRLVAKKEYEHFERLFAPDIIFHLHGDSKNQFAARIVGREKVIATMVANFELLIHQLIDIRSVNADASSVSLQFLEQGQVSATGNQYEALVMHNYTFKDGAMVEVHILADVVPN